MFARRCLATYHEMVLVRLTIVLVCVRHVGPRPQAHDPQTCESFVGFVYEPAVREMLRRDGSVQAWQRKEVLGLLMSRVALVDSIRAPTHELRRANASRTVVLHQVGVGVKGGGGWHECPKSHGKCGGVTS